MKSEIHFEQLMAEIRNSLPESVNICATETPLQVWVDGGQLDLTSFMRQHNPLRLRVMPGTINAKSDEAARVTISSPGRSGQIITIRLTNSVLEHSERIRLDDLGNAEIEVSSNVIGDIEVNIPEAMVSTSILVG